MSFFDKVREFIAGFRHARKIVKEHRTELQIRADAFNYDHTYTYAWLPNPEEAAHPRMQAFVKYPHYAWLAWMCPDCGTVHRPYGFDDFVGVMYPACCKTPRGDRNRKEWGYLRNNFGFTKESQGKHT